MAKRNDTPAKEEKGQSLVEFAFGITFMIILLAGIVDFSRAFFTYMALRDAVQEGALYGSLHPTSTAGIEARVQGIGDGPIDFSQVTVNSAIIGDFPCAGFEIRVQATYQFPISMPFIGAIVGSQSFPLSASATDFIVSPPCE